MSGDCRWFYTARMMPRASRLVWIGGARTRRCRPLSSARASRQIFACPPPRTPASACRVDRQAGRWWHVSPQVVCSAARHAGAAMRGAAPRRVRTLGCSSPLRVILIRARGVRCRDSAPLIFQTAPFVPRLPTRFLMLSKTSPLPRARYAARRPAAPGMATRQPASTEREKRAVCVEGRERRVATSTPVCACRASGVQIFHSAAQRASVAVRHGALCST